MNAQQLEYFRQQTENQRNEIANAIEDSLEQGVYSFKQAFGSVIDRDLVYAGLEIKLLDDPVIFWVDGCGFGNNTGEKPLKELWEQDLLLVYEELLNHKPIKE